MGSGSHTVIIVGAGPGGLSTAIALHQKGIQDVLLIDRGTIGQSWLDYPPETRLLSQSTTEVDENMVGDCSVCDFMPNIPHPTHTIYQKYLVEVANHHHVSFREHVNVTAVQYDADKREFVLSIKDSAQLRCTYLVWATGMYSTPDEQLACSGCYIHYSRIQDWTHITDNDVSVIGGANGATEVVIQLAKPERKVRLICSREFDVPSEQKLLWQQNRKLVQDLANQGLVEIVENFRVKKIYHDDVEFIIESNDMRILRSSTRPIVCIGFLPNIAPVETLVDIIHEGHDTFLGLDEAHQSKKTPGLFFAGTIGKLTHDQGFIKDFRNFGALIAERMNNQK